MAKAYRTVALLIGHVGREGAREPSNDSGLILVAVLSTNGNAANAALHSILNGIRYRRPRVCLAAQARLGTGAARRKPWMRPQHER